MSPLLNKYKFTLALLVMLFAVLPHLFAQCSIAKKNTIGQMGIETPDTYQYIRNNDQYHGISIRSILLKNSTGNEFYAYVIYSGNKLNFIPVTLAFNFIDEHNTTVKLIFFKNKTTDNSKLNTRIYKIKLTNVQVNELGKNELKSLNVISKTGSMVVIPVNDPAVMRSQITCLQSAAP